MSISAPTITIRSKSREEAPLIYSTAYSGTGNHRSTTYNIKLAGVMIWTSTSIIPIVQFRLPLGILHSGVTYTIEVIYNSATESSPAGSISYTTESSTNWKYIEKPTISISNIAGQPVVCSTTVISSVGGSSSHISSSWQVVKKAGYTVIIYEPESTANKTTFSIPRTTLVEGETYIIKCRHIGEDAYVRSDYAEIEFTVSSSGKPLTPVITVEGEFNSVPEDPLISTSAFGVTSGVDTHLSTDYEIHQI